MLRTESKGSRDSMKRLLITRAIEKVYMLQPALKSDRMCYPVAITLCPYSFSNLRRSEECPQGAYGLQDVKKCDGC